MRRLVIGIVLTIAIAGCSSDSSGSHGATPGSDAGIDGSTGTSDASATDATTTSADATKPTSDAAAPDAGPDVSYVDMGPVGGDRPAKVVTPKDWSADKTYPVLLMLHGYSVNARLQDAYFRTSTLVDELQFVLVEPDGLVDTTGKHFWNATDFCCDLYGNGVDDSTYLSNLVKEVLARYSGDPKRVYILGHSNGGFMAYRLACDHGDQFAAIASLAGAGWLDDSKCQWSSPMSVLDIHGTADTTILYDGLANEYPGSEEMVNRWVTRDNCTTGPTDVRTADYDSAAIGDETAVQQWTGCDQGTDVEHWKMTGSGHIPAIGSDFTRDVLAFLFAHPKP